MTCHEMLTCPIYFDEFVHGKDIINLKCFNKFTNVGVSNLMPLPLSINRLTFTSFIENFKNSYIPSSVTYLTNPPYNGDLIPSSVTHLDFSWCWYNKLANYKIPSFVQYIDIKIIMYTGIHIKNNFIPQTVRQITVNFININSEKQTLLQSLSNGVTKIVFET